MVKTWEMCFRKVQRAEWYRNVFDLRPLDEISNQPDAVNVEKLPKTDEITVSGCSSSGVSEGRVRPTTTGGERREGDKRVDAEQKQVDRSLLSWAAFIVPC